MMLSSFVPLDYTRFNGSFFTLRVRGSSACFGLYSENKTTHYYLDSLELNDPFICIYEDRNAWLQSFSTKKSL
jgi:hypothetical protein